MVEQRSQPSFGVAVIALFVGMQYEAVCADLAETGQDGIRHYQRSYFEKFSPLTALDIVNRVPGFSIDVGDDVRGFGGGAGNVLIDGARPSSKNGGVEESLQRILASSVVRVELIVGTASGTEVSEQILVANVVTTSVQSSRQWTLEVERAPDGDVNGRVEVLLTQPAGHLFTSAKLVAYREHRPLDGRRISYDANDNATFYEWESSPSETRYIGLSTHAERPVAGGILSANWRISRRPLSVETVRDGYDDESKTGTGVQQLAIALDQVAIESELGIDWSRAMSDTWALKLLSLSSLERHESQSTVNLDRPVGMAATSSLFQSDQLGGESIVRGAMTYTGHGGRRTEFGAELAYNRLDSRLTLRVNEGDGPEIVDLAASNVVVDEIRGEAFASILWRAGDTLLLETGLAVEHSRISVRGDATSTRSFTFLKPSATLVHSVRDGVQLQLSAARRAGQLDFRDFAASASAADDRFLGGNPELRPDQAARLSASLDLRSEVYGALNIEVFYESRDDVLEQIILPSGVAGLGNAGSAEMWGVSLMANVPLYRFIPGGLLDIEARSLSSRLRDPITSTSRPLSGIDDLDVVIELRQDRIGAPFAWGIWYRPPVNGPFYFVDEISFNRDSRSFGAYLETTRLLGLKARLSVSGIGRQVYSRERRLFERDRSGEYLSSEVVNRGHGTFVTLNLTGQL